MRKPPKGRAKYLMCGPIVGQGWDWERVSGFPHGRCPDLCWVIFVLSDTWFCSGFCEKGKSLAQRAS